MARWLDRWRGHGSALPPDERRRRRRELLVIAVISLALGLFALLEFRLPSLRSAEGLSGNILYFLLVNLNLILLVLLVFLLARNLTKLALERRRGIFGSRLRTRLVLAFTALTLVPAALLFFVAEKVLTAAFDTWFNVRVESSLEGSLDIAENYYQFAAGTAQHFADELARQVRERGLMAPGQRAALQRFVEERHREYGVAGVQVFGPGGETLARAASGELRGAAEVQPPDLLSELFEGEGAAATIPHGRRDIVRVGAPVRAPGSEAVIGAVAVDYLVPRRVSETARDLARAYHEYRTLASMKQPIKNVYILTLALVTLTVVFLATWFGLRQAQAITGPLGRLAEGTRAVAQGNWSYRIDAVSDADVAVLVDSFNQMTAALEQMHGELVERRTELENILENIAAGVVSLDAGGRVTMLNPAAERMLGLSFAAVRGARWTEVFDGSDLRAVGAAIREAAASGEEVQREVKLLGGEHILTALVTVTSLRDAAQVHRGTMLFLEDVTHLQRVQRMEAWREVARRLAHEIKNPLTPIQLSAQRLRRRYGERLAGPDGQVFDECTRTIIRQVEELKRLVNEFSMFARLPALELTPQDLNAVVEEAVVLYREAHPEIRFELRLAPALPQVALDREAMKRALINMLDNAVAACRDVPEGGRIEVSTAALPVPGVVRLELADNGPGLSRDVKLRLFEPYFSTKKEGTGLGLAIVASILADHRAYIRVRDNHPRGARFVIEFPVHRAVAAGDRVAARG